MTVRRPLIMDAGKVRVMPVGDTVPAVLIPDIYFPAIYSGRIDPSDYVFALCAPVAFNLPGDLPGSVARAKIGSTGVSVMSIRKNGAQIGSLTFTASATGLFSSVGTVSFAVGDLLEIVAAPISDATLADIRLTIAAVQTS